MSRLIQLMGDGIEELWEFDDDHTDEMIQRLYKEYQASDFESFEDFIEAKTEHRQPFCTRLYVEEVYV